MGGEEEVRLLSEIVSIYSPSGREAKLARYLYEKLLVDYAFDQVKLDGVGNVIGVLEGGRPTVLLCGHLDTVPGRLPVRMHDGYLYGRGSVDAKGALAAMIVAAKRLRDSGYKGRIIVAGVVDEEGRGLGAKHLIKSGLEIDYAIFGEPSGLTQVTIGYKGRVQLRLEVRTESFHASSPWLGRNALDHALRIWDSVREYVGRERGKTYFDSLSACITMVKAGVAANVAPPECELVIDIRIPPRLRAYKVINDLAGIIRDYVSSNEDSLEVRVVPEEVTEAFIVSKNNNLVSSLAAAVFMVTGSRAKLVRKTGTGDMNLLGFSLSVPVATYGPGDPKLSHTSQERISIEEYLKSIRVLETALRILYRRHHR